MISEENWEVEWVVAALAPWTISPHPNFRNDDAFGPAALALVTEMRDRNEGLSNPHETGSQSELSDVLVETARLSLIQSTQQDSAEKLLELSASRELSVGARAVSALFGSVALCELERHNDAVTALTCLLRDLCGTDRNPSEFAASQRLIVAVLYMQLSTRLTEMCRFEDARDTVERTIYWLPTLRSPGLQGFSVSEGISWGAATVQRDLIRSVRSHALSLKSYLEQIGGHTWVRVVRGRSSWVDARLNRRSSDRDGIVLRDAYERRIEADSNTQHYGRLTAESAGYRSLTLAELSGYLGLIVHERESLGKVLLLERSTDPERVREALRLLRQGGATKALQSAITWIRAQGPSESLVNDALTIVDRVNSDGWCTEQDLLILEGVSEFLTSDQKDRAIGAALRFIDTPKMQHRLTWSSWDRLWKTLTKLVPASNKHALLADKAISYIEQQDSLALPITSTLARLVYALDWGEVDERVAARWTHLVREAERNMDTDVLFSAIDEEVRGVVRSVPTALNLDRAAHLADGGLPPGDLKEAVSEIEEYLLGLLRKEMEDAARGRMSLGGYQTLNIAVAFALRFPGDELWDGIVRHVLDEHVDLSLKDLGVDRLAENVARLPESVATELAEGIQSLHKSRRRDDSFANPGSTVSGEVVRLSGALGAVSKSDLLETLLRLATGGVRDRIEAAKCIPFGISDKESTWGHVLLLQLSHDLDPSVRAAAGHALVRSLAYSSELDQAIYSRIAILLSRDGIKVPLAVLHGVQRTAEGLGDRLAPLIAPIRSVVDSGGNYLTEGAARLCLEMLDGHGGRGSSRGK